jgi:fructose-1,6-bisphosphatase/inositol monophosphatase family enzyme
MTNDTELENLLQIIRTLHEKIRAAVVGACEATAITDLAQIAKEEEGDTIYAVDRVSEELIVEYFAENLAAQTPVVIIGEGLETGKVVLPEGANEEDAKWRIIVDPIDGTRGIMYQKRPAWILTGVAPNLGENTSLQDIVLAVQTEIPLVKQHLSDTLWAMRGRGAFAERFNRITNERTPLFLKPSAAETIAHGYAQISRFFPGAREELAAIDEEIVRGALGDVQKGKTHCFEDQYTSTGGQIYELLSGHDRFTADLRPLMERKLNERGLFLGICCHPYDICTELIARESGVIITDAEGNPVNAKLAVEPDVDWIGYANAAIRAQIEPLLQESLRKRNLLK